MKHLLTTQVESRDDMSAEDAAVMLDKLFNAGLSDAAATVREDEGDAGALAVLELNISSPKPSCDMEAMLTNTSRLLLEAAIMAEDFMSGFEDDEMQEGIDEKLAMLRYAIGVAKGEIQS